MGARPTGVLRGSGQQFVGSVINFVSYYGIAVPAMVYFAFTLDLRLQGLWFGLMLGVGLQTLMLLLLTWRTDWAYQASRDANECFACCFCDGSDTEWAILVA